MFVPPTAAIERRAQGMEAWLANPVLLAPDPDAEYAKAKAFDSTIVRQPGPGRGIQK